MTPTTHLVIEVRYVPLPAEELAELRARLQALLLRGALRLIRQESADASTPAEVDPAEVVPK
jgi:hypothetical protein